MNKRIERDSMGEMELPADALYGASTQRAIDNFPISGRRLPRPFLRALGLIKQAAAETNGELGTLDRAKTEAIAAAAGAVAEGLHDEHFPVDVYQTGSGTSTNMNANEVIANLALRALGAKLGDRSVIHPNDHVNYGQSSNDVIPTALHVSCAEQVHGTLIPVLQRLQAALSAKGDAFDDVVKLGRTHLQDATPVRMGQVFHGYAAQIERGGARLRDTLERLCELALGGTAVGTGINCPPGFAAGAIGRLAQKTGVPFREAGNHFEAQGARDAAVELSGALKTVAVSLYRIANEIRFLGSGPRGGVGELRIPATQPGSSIMPGKVNPVICEAVLQVCMRVMGNDATVTAGGVSGVFELNVAIPVMADTLLESIALLANASDVFIERCVEGLEVDRDRVRSLIERSLMLVTALAPKIGYDKAAQLAKRAHERGQTVREAAAEMGLEDLDDLLDLRAMTEPPE